MGHRQPPWPLWEGSGGSRSPAPAPGFTSGPPVSSGSYTEPLYMLSGEMLCCCYSMRGRGSSSVRGLWVLTTREESWGLWGVWGTSPPCLQPLNLSRGTH